MEKNNDIFNQFKNASEKSEQRSHPINEAIWDKIETNLDTKVLRKKNKIWKRLAIAASLLFFISMTFVFLQKENPKNTIENSMVVTDSVSKISLPEENLAVEELDKTEIETKIKENKNIQPNAKIILDKAIESEADNAVVLTKPENNSGYIENIERSSLVEKSKKETRFSPPKFEARGVIAAPINTEIEVANDQVKPKPEPPLLILNNKAVTGESGKKYRNLTDSKMNEIGKENLENVVYLAEPLYVIDGKQYTEDEMYGENPTSPYAPLSNQEIVNTVVLQGKEATKAFGKKGEKGVLIITTKNGKPKSKGK
jgi:hypothetical protein